MRVNRHENTQSNNVGMYIDTTTYLVIAYWVK